MAQVCKDGPTSAPRVSELNPWLLTSSSFLLLLTTYSWMTGNLELQVNFLNAVEFLDVLSRL